MFPYLSLRSPTKECGKSRLLDALSIVAFTASRRETNPTEAVLFRHPAKNGGTLLLDEVENLRGDKEKYNSLLAVLNSGFEQGGQVSRIEKRSERFEYVSCPTSCPRALAGINALKDTLEGRSIAIFMERRRKDERLERFSQSRLDDAMQGLRDDLYIWALTHFEDLAMIYENMELFEGLEELGDRERDLFEPLVSIALLTDSEAGKNRALIDELISLANEMSKVRREMVSGHVPQILEVL